MFFQQVVNIVVKENKDYNPLPSSTFNLTLYLKTNRTNEYN